MELAEQLGYYLLALELWISCIDAPCILLAKLKRIFSRNYNSPLRIDQQHTSPASRSPNKLPNQITNQPLYWITETLTK
jgi:hypothetical protein